jgi:hypothetical protein
VVGATLGSCEKIGSSAKGFTARHPHKMFFGGLTRILDLRKPDETFFDFERDFIETF